MRILFVCRGNVGRSQMAEALFRQRFGDAHEASSAGTKLSGPEQSIGELLPATKEVLDVMGEVGLDISGALRKQLTEQMVMDADRVVAIIEDKEPLPEYLSGSAKLVRWNVPDPKGRDLAFTRGVRNVIRERVDTLSPHMYFKSKKISLLVLGITALICSRALFFFFDDPEGPNLLIVTVMALILYFVSLTVYRFNLSLTGLKKLLLAICIQVLLAGGLYVCLS